MASSFKANDVMFTFFSLIKKLVKKILFPRGKRNVALRSLENIENESKDAAQNFYSHDIGLVDRLSGLK